MNNDMILKLYNRPQTVFTIDEIAQLFPAISYESLRDRLYYFNKIGKLKHPRQGMYAKQTFNILELANKIYTPSYISLETVLTKAGVVFQYYEKVFLVTYITRSVMVNNAEIQYRQLKEGILTNMQGVEYKEGYFIASLERAFLDAVYIYKNYHFDNLGALNWEKVEALQSIYTNKAFEKRVGEYYKLFKEEYGKD